MHGQKYKHYGEPEKNELLQLHSLLIHTSLENFVDTLATERGITT